MKRLATFIAAFACTWLLILSACSAQAPPVNVNAEGFAVKGYDTVAYFTLGQPVKGKSAFQLEWNDAKWQFSSAEHLHMFRDNPEKFAPQYGGY